MSKWSNGITPVLCGFGKDLVGFLVTYAGPDSNPSTGNFFDLAYCYFWPCKCGKHSGIKTLFPWHISWSLLFTSIETELKFQFDFSSFKAHKITLIQCPSNHHVGWFVMYTAGFEFLMRKLKKSGPDLITSFPLSLSVNNFREAFHFLPCSPLQ